MHFSTLSRDKTFSQMVNGEVIKNKKKNSATKSKEAVS